MIWHLRYVDITAAYVRLVPICFMVNDVNDIFSGFCTGAVNDGVFPTGCP